MTTELLGLHPSWVRNQQGSVISHQLLLQLHRTVSIDIFGIVSNDSLGDGLSDSVDLRRMSSTLHTDTDIEDGE